MTKTRGLRFEFEGIDQDALGAVVVWGGNGISSAFFNVAAGEPGNVDVRREDFAGTADWTDVIYVGTVIQSGGLVPSHDYAIRSIRVLPTLETAQP